MHNVKNKKELKEISKRWAKSILFFTEPAIAFENLSEEECNYIKDCILKIADKITDKDVVSDSNKLAEEYFE